MARPEPLDDTDSCEVDTGSADGSGVTGDCTLKLELELELEFVDEAAGLLSEFEPTGAFSGTGVAFSTSLLVNPVGVSGLVSLVVAAP